MQKEGFIGRFEIIFNDNYAYFFKRRKVRKYNKRNKHFKF